MQKMHNDMCVPGPIIMIRPMDLALGGWGGGLGACMHYSTYTEVVEDEILAALKLS